MLSLVQIVKYLLEGLAVAVAAFFIPNRKNDIVEILTIGLAASVTFALLDLFAPSVSSGARTGAGFGIGLNQVGWGGDQQSEAESTTDTQEE